MTAQICATCLKPEHLCVCDAIEPVDNRIFVLILQHPQEKREILGTAQIAHLQLRNSAVRIGLSWPGLKRLLGREVDPRRWAVLYLGTAKQGAEQDAKQDAKQSAKPAPGEVGERAAQAAQPARSGAWTHRPTGSRGAETRSSTRRTTSSHVVPRKSSSGSSTIRWARTGTASVFTSSGTTYARP